MLLFELASPYLAPPITWIELAGDLPVLGGRRSSAATIFVQLCQRGALDLPQWTFKYLCDYARRCGN